MGVIEELGAKLRGAQHAVKKAQREYDESATFAGEKRKELEQWQARVNELERAISLLRNGLKPATVQTGNVTVLKR